MTPQEIHAEAMTYLGTAEISGARHNPKVVQFFATVGHSWVRDDETAWCAAFVGHVLETLGIRSTRALNARSYREWGTEVPLASAAPGDLCVFWRGSPTSWMGHVGFFHALKPGAIAVLGGNQGNRVSIADYTTDRLLAVRRAPGVSLPPAAPLAVPLTEAVEAAIRRIVREEISNV